jgi:hypothetical protein
MWRECVPPQEPQNAEGICTTNLKAKNQSKNYVEYTEVRLPNKLVANLMVFKLTHFAAMHNTH